MYSNDATGEVIQMMGRTTISSSFVYSSPKIVSTWSLLVIVAIYNNRIMIGCDMETYNNIYRLGVGSDRTRSFVPRFLITTPLQRQLLLLIVMRMVMSFPPEFLHSCNKVMMLDFASREVIIIVMMVDAVVMLK